MPPLLIEEANDTELPAQSGLDVVCVIEIDGTTELTKLIVVDAVAVQPFKVAVTI